MADRLDDSKLTADGTSQSPARSLPSSLRGISVLIVFCLHNSWNCWVFLNASSDVEAAKELFGLNDSEVGTLNTVGLLGIGFLLPVATVCKWPRALLWFGGIINVASPILRYYGAKSGSYWLVVATFAGNGMAYGVIGVWPPILAVTFAREERHAVVTAVALLSNWLGGAMAAIITPLVSRGQGDGLLALLEGQAYVSVGLLAITACWLWIPDIVEDTPLPILEELQVCGKREAATQILNFGIITGVAVSLQNVIPILLEGVGLSEVTAGFGNCIFQIAGAVIGVGLGSFVTTRHQLRRVLWWFHSIALLSCLGMFILALAFAGKHSNNNISTAALLAMVTVQGASVVGALPFVMQQAVYTSHPATEKCVAGLVTTIGGI